MFRVIVLMFCFLLSADYLYTQVIAEGYGLSSGAHIGARKSHIRQVYGTGYDQSVVRSRGCYDCDTKTVTDTVIDRSIWGYEQEGITVFWNKGRIEKVIFYGPEFKLSNGLGIGSSVSELQEIYGHQLYVRIYRYPERGIIFYTENDLISAIAVIKPSP